MHPVSHYICKLVMRKISSYRIRSARFRRWNRSPYAVFNSIGRHVTIGHLKADIADASLKKEKSIHSLSVARFILEHGRTFKRGTFSGDEASSPPGLAEVLAAFSFSEIRFVSEASAGLQRCFAYSCGRKAYWLSGHFFVDIIGV